MKIIYIKGKPIKRIACPSCGEIHLTGDKVRLDRALAWRDAHNLGLSYRSIAENTGVSYFTIQRHVKMLGEDV